MERKMGILSGKVALITGGGKGMGRAAARLFAAEGARVAIAARTEADLQEAAREIGDATLPIRLDVTDIDAWADGIAQVERHWGKLNILVNAAGLSESALIEIASAEHWRRHLKINVEAIFYGCQAALPLIKASGEPGSIVNISSSFGQRPIPGFAAYCASKAALTMMTKVLALECASAGDQIRANTVHPGGTETEMLERALAETGLPRDEAYAMFVKIHPMGRMGRPEEVAQACLWLASDASSFTTGVELNVDGGSFIRP
jgi:NAD(P)-dependent dehydrogenase (short-subunit alcohol dehydrogenase family)